MRRFNKTKLLICAFGAFIIAIFSVAFAFSAVAPSSINLTGSSSMLPLMSQYSNSYDGANITVSGGGSGKGLQDITLGNTDVGNTSSREQSTIEQTPNYKSAWEKRNIRTVTIAIDAIGIVVHMPNGVQTINDSMPIIDIKELAKIYEFNPQPIKWNQLVTNLVNSTSPSSSSTVTGFGRLGGKSASGTSDGFFAGLGNLINSKSEVAKFDVNHTSLTIKTTPEANSAAFQAVNSASQGVNYLSLGYAISATADSISKTHLARIKLPNDKIIDPTVDNVKTQEYTWTRPFNCSFSITSDQYIKNFIYWALLVSLDPDQAKPSYNQHFKIFQKIFNESNCIPLTSNQVYFQLLTINDNLSDFQLLNTSSNINLNGIVLQIWNWSETIEPVSITPDQAKTLAFGLDLENWKN